MELTEAALPYDMAVHSEVQQQKHPLGACLAMQNLRPQPDRSPAAQSAFLQDPQLYNSERH